MFALLNTLPLNALQLATISGMLENTSSAVGNWGKYITLILGYGMLLVGIIAIIGGMAAIKKHQPSTTFWIVAAISLVAGGYFARDNGFSSFQSDSNTQGKDAIDGVLNHGK